MKLIPCILAKRIRDSRCFVRRAMLYGSTMKWLLSCYRHDDDSLITTLEIDGLMSSKPGEMRSWLLFSRREALIMMLWGDDNCKLIRSWRSFHCWLDFLRISLYRDLMRRAIPMSRLHIRREIHLVSYKIHFLIMKAPLYHATKRYCASDKDFGIDGRSITAATTLDWLRCDVASHRSRCMRHASLISRYQLILVF